MRSLHLYTTSARRPPSSRERIQHPDVDLLTQMACAVAVFRYQSRKEYLSRSACFRIAWNYLADELWPLASCVPEQLRMRSVFLGGGYYREGSLRRWVGDCHGMVAAESFSNQSALRHGRASRKMAANVHANAEAHMRSIINAVEDLPSNLEDDRLLRALHQLHKELF